MNCEVCAKKTSTRIVLGVKLCENCFSLITKLREADPGACKYFSNRYNLIYSSSAARNLIDNYMPKDFKPEAAAPAPAQTDEKLEAKEPAPKKDKYDVVEFTGSSAELKNLLNEKAESGYKLHTLLDKDEFTQIIFEQDN